jgi:hypothetical protein
MNLSPKLQLVCINEILLLSPEIGNLTVFVVAAQVTTRLPVCSALFKQRTGGLVVRWVTTGESPLLNVFFGDMCDRFGKQCVFLLGRGGGCLSERTVQYLFIAQGALQSVSHKLSNDT